MQAALFVLLSSGMLVVQNKRCVTHTQTRTQFWQQKKKFLDTLKFKPTYEQ